MCPAGQFCEFWVLVNLMCLSMRYYLLLLCLSLSLSLCLTGHCSPMSCFFLKRFILQCCPFSYHIWSAIFDLDLLLFNCRWLALPLYTLSQLQGIEYMQFLVMFCWGLDLKKIFLKSQATPEYCPNIIWTTYLLVLLS